MQIPIELTLPATTEWMLVIRLTATGVLARMGVAVDRMDDLKMAVEEACRCLMEQSTEPQKLHLRFECCDRVLLMIFHALDGHPSDQSPNEQEMAITTCILNTMADEVKLETLDGGIESIAMKVKVS